jgi:peptidoglycan/LPS O-acetylase OafA/YrhL
VQSLIRAELCPSPTSLSAEAVSRSPAAVTSRLQSLDGWRAVSILMVLGCHAAFVAGFPFSRSPVYNLVFDGNLGVRFFFVISGFLITWLMILERDKNGSVSLREFYIRRCLRILPIYVVFLSVLAVLEVTGVAKQSPAAWIGSLTFTRNSFGGVTGGDSFSAHLWSLSVEEQFYLAWPVLFFLLGRRGDRSILGLLAIAILAVPAIPGINSMSLYTGGFYSQVVEPFLSWNSLKYFNCLAFGCLGAVLFAHHRKMIEEYLKRLPFLTAGLGIGLILFPYLSSFLPLKAITVEHLGPSFQALGFTILLLHSVIAPEWGLYRILNWEWVRRIGVWSYSLYIWQQLFWRSPQSFGLNHIWWMGVWLVPLFAVTLLSYYGLERPFFKLRSRHREVKLTE